VSEAPSGHASPGREERPGPRLARTDWHDLWQKWRAYGAPRASLALFLAAIIGYYAFVISAGHFSYWPDQGRDPPTYYDTQAEGFRAGHLYTTELPDPRLLRVSDPYDYQNRGLWTWDYSLYGGHLYLYWGLAPAALLALAKTLLRAEAPIRDALLVFVFLLGRLLAGCLLIRALARQWKPEPPVWSVWLALLVFAVAHPTPFLLARPAVYEAALSGGACFLTAATYFAFSWLFSNHPADRVRGLAACSLCLGFGGTCRPSLLPAGAGMLALLLLFGVRRSPALGWPPKWGRSVLRVSAAAALPFTALVLAHLVVNHLRFGSWKEFGVHYQLGIPFAMSARFVPANLWSYLFHSLHSSCRFPFLIPCWHNDFPLSHYLPAWLPLPDGYYGYEPLAGVSKAVPFSWLICPLLVLYVWRQRAGAIHSTAGDARWRWFCALLALATVAASVPLLMMFAFSMRYEAEFLSSVLLLATLGGWALLRLPRASLGAWLAKITYCGLAGSSVLIGAAYGFSGYFQLFATQHAQLFQPLQEKLDFCSRDRASQRASEQRCNR
jgi:hypothetical protein